MTNTVVCHCLLLLQALSLHAYENVALRGKATQSSQLKETWSAISGASNAIDGNRDTNFYGGSCTHTITQSDPWWRVDLLKSYVVTSITVSNREDCCSDRLEGAKVLIGNSLQNNGFDNPVAFTLTAKALQTLYLSDGMQGRYVIVMLPGSGKTLTLCEVEVYGYHAPTDVNLALRGKATQSTLFEFGFAYNAIDGNRKNLWELGSCSQTQEYNSPWWRVDLVTTHKVFSVVITSMSHPASGVRGAELRIGNSLENDGTTNNRCAVIEMNPGVTMRHECNGMDGRYVVISIPGGKTTLSLCEVEVYGSVLD